MFSLMGSAQRNCPTIIPTPEEFSRDPKLRSFYDSLDTDYRTWLANFTQRQSVTRVFPIVVHVLYNVNSNHATNISDAQIFSQINIINNDFQRLNADWTNTPDVWEGLVANNEIKFCLASKDPAGNITSGIIRKFTDSTNFIARTSPKHNNTGGSDAWPVDRYINVWVIPQSGTLLGYATFPWISSGAEDGIVIKQSAFGNIGTATPPYNLGRTLTHELGHFFGLIHIWGDDTGCMGTDQVDDTPDQFLQNGGCPTFPLIDNCSILNPGVMFMNYMDYTDDNCMYMFTTGQKIRMDFHITNFANRQVLLSNTNTSCGGCIETLNLSGNSPVGGAYYKTAAINSTQVVSAGGILTYKASTTIRLLPGFRCNTGRVFFAGTEVCYPPF